MSTVGAYLAISQTVSQSVALAVSVVGMGVSLFGMWDRFTSRAYRDEHRKTGRRQ